MTDEVSQFWQHAETALSTARRALQFDSATAANRAYYAAFYAVSALFRAEGTTFRKHAAIEAAVHRDLVNTGRWSEELGAAFSELNVLRIAADYDVSTFTSFEDAEQAMRKAEEILKAVRATCPDVH